MTIWEILAYLLSVIPNMDSQLLYYANGVRMKTYYFYQFLINYKKQKHNKNNNNKLIMVELSKNFPNRTQK